MYRSLAAFFAESSLVRKLLPHLLQPNIKMIQIRQRSDGFSTGTMADSISSTSLFLCFGFSCFIYLLVVQLLYVEILMDHTGHFSIHSIQKMILRKPQQPKTTSSRSANTTTTTTSKMIHAVDIFLSTQLLSVLQNMQENGLSIPSSEIPSVEDMEKLYGKHARIYGLKDSCPASMPCARRFAAYHRYIRNTYELTWYGSTV